MEINYRYLLKVFIGIVFFTGDLGVNLICICIVCMEFYFRGINLFCKVINCKIFNFQYFGINDFNGGFHDELDLYCVDCFLFIWNECFVIIKKFRLSMFWNQSFVMEYKQMINF